MVDDIFITSKYLSTEKSMVHYQYIIDFKIMSSLLYIH